MSPEHTLTNSEVALLGLLSEKAKHAYQIGRDVEHRDMRSWTDLSQSTIYRQLTSLHKAGLVDSAQDVVDGRARKVYSLTDAGLDALRDRLLGLLAEPESPTWGIDLATYNANLVPAKDAVDALERYRGKLQEGIACWEATEKYMSSCTCPKHRLAVVRRPRYLLKAEIRWVDDFVAELKEAHDA
ncbi:MAG: PadR family transcriptional regulator [Actinomycetota bacterium]|jgi:DNA-binding PadR family transcriptional regulator|nr:PadR family transcriptional regulator [Actinomycetota bacterium]